MKSKVKNVFSYHFLHWSKVPWLCNHFKRLINNKDTSQIRCFDQVFLYSMMFYVNILTGMVLNNTISWSATLDSTAQYLNTDLFTWTRICIADSSCSCQSARHHTMSIFLLESYGGAPQNMRFNVFVILVCSIYGKNNIWHVKSWHFTLAG